MGMYDVMPTLGNMMGFENPFALGHDIFNIGEDNVVIFPNGNFITNKIYYNNSSSSYVTLNRKYYDKTKRTYETIEPNSNAHEGVEIDDDYINELKEYIEKRLDVSNAIIVHDLIINEGDKILKEEGIVEWKRNTKYRYL